MQHVEQKDNHSIDHSTLPSISNAQLPVTYERAKTALAECSQIDECKEWADKASALASYARQSKDDSLRKMAERIKARAIRRAGELLKQIEKSNKHQNAGDRKLTRSGAATEAGMSPHQQRTAQEVASVPESEFTEMVESDSPPTVTKLAEIGTKRQLVDLEGRDPKEFNRALHFVALFERHLRASNNFDIEEETALLTDKEREKLRKIIDQIDVIHDKVITRI